MKTKYIYSGIKGILKYEGALSLVSRGLAFFAHRFFNIESYFVVYTDLEKSAKGDTGEYQPEISNCEAKIISTNREVDELVAGGFTLGAYELNLRASLDKGVTEFCIFYGKDLAHIVCLTDNPRGKNVIDPRPFDVNFNDGEAVTGRALTAPKYRRLHLRTYSGYLLRQYCFSKGIRRVRGTILANNYAALASLARFTNRFALSRCRYVKILRFEYLKETKMEPTSLKTICELEFPHARKRTKNGDAKIPAKD